MRVYKARSGPFIERPFYTSSEVESMCTEELTSVGLFPLEPSPIRIERFIEKRFNIHPAYELLPDGILGYIIFGEEGVRGIVISSALAEESTRSAERRISTTLAHEAGHALLHTHLFVLGQPGAALFGSGLDQKKPAILCRNDAIQGIPGFKAVSYDGCWWEYQANLAIGPFLLPRSLVMLSLQPYLISSGVMGTPLLDRHHQEAAVNKLSEVFEVNPIVARIRLDSLFPASQDQQLTL
jgi:hypothetical protein